MNRKVLATVIIIISMGLVACKNSATNRNNQGITIEEAKEIALNHANLTSDKVSFIRTEVDSENGVEKYDIEFYYGNKEYDYEINAINGQIIEYDEDIENYNIPNSGQSNNTTENQQPNNGTGNQQSNNATANQQPNSSSQNQQSSGGTTQITVEEAKQIALNHANLTSNQVSFIKSEVDLDDGIKKYDIEFNCNGREYNYEIDANTGSILSYDQD